MNRNGYEFIPCPTPNHGGINVAHRPCHRCGYAVTEKQEPPTVKPTSNINSEALNEGQTNLFVAPQEPLW